MQLALRAEKLSGERISWGKFQKKKGFGFVSNQSSKKSQSFESFGNSFRSNIDSVSFLLTFRSPQPSKLGKSPPSFVFKGRAMSKKCPCCCQFHSRACNAPQLCYQCGQTGHVKRFCPMLSSIRSVGHSFEQPRALVQGFGRLVMRPSGSSRLATSSSYGTQGVQRPQMTHTRIFAMTVDEA